MAVVAVDVCIVVGVMGVVGGAVGNAGVVVIVCCCGRVWCVCVGHVAGGANAVASGALSMSSCCKLFANSCSAHAGIDVRGHVGIECCVRS